MGLITAASVVGVIALRCAGGGAGYRASAVTQGELHFKS